MNAVGDDMQRILVQTMERHTHVPHGPDAVLEGALFAFCSVAFDTRPDGVTGEQVLAMMNEQAGRYLAFFQAEAVIGQPMGTA